LEEGESKRESNCTKVVVHKKMLSFNQKRGPGGLPKKRHAGSEDGGKLDPGQPTAKRQTRGQGTQEKVTNGDTLAPTRI